MIKHHFICVLMAILFFAKHDSLFAQGQYTEINNFSMYYEIHGKGEPILLIHGGLGSIGNFSNQIKAFSDSFSVIVCPLQNDARRTCCWNDDAARHDPCPGRDDLGQVRLWPIC